MRGAVTQGHRLRLVEGDFAGLMGFAVYSAAYVMDAVEDASIWRIKYTHWSKKLPIFARLFPSTCSSNAKCSKADALSRSNPIMDNMAWLRRAVEALAQLVKTRGLD